MPANTLSRRIDQLEGQLGKRLLPRSTRRISGISARRRFTICAAVKNTLARSAGEDSDQRPECSEHGVEHPC
jgi:DNA-binding transcriptional LysR family regulator